ncbi:MAG: hypothetical protein ACI4TP_01245 [Anaerotignum sp.]
MARIPNIGFQLKQALRKMAAFGERKKEYKDETARLRAEYKTKLMEQGYSKKEAHKMAQSICTYRNKIFAQSTMTSYQKAAGVFEQFCFETLGTKRVSMEEAKNHVQEFVNWGIQNGHSPDTIHTRLSGVCKALGLTISDFDSPARHYADAVRSVKPAINDEYNAVHAQKALEANRIIGIRRNELAGLKCSDIHFISDERVEVYSIGKGGKHNVNIISDKKDISTLKAMVQEAESQCREHLLDKADLNNDADLHHERAECAKDVYYSVCSDMEENPQKRDYYKTQIEQIFNRNGKTLKENLDSPYRCRGQNRQKLEELGKPTVFDRVAVLYVSCTVTNHFRSDTTVQHYLVK